MNSKEFKKEIKKKTKEEIKSMFEGHHQVYFIIIEGVPHRVDYLPNEDRLWLNSKEIKE